MTTKQLLLAWFLWDKLDIGKTRYDPGLLHEWLLEFNAMTSLDLHEFELYLKEAYSEYAEIA
jgi:hypothetical protein